MSKLHVKASGTKKKFRNLGHLFNYSHKTVMKELKRNNAQDGRYTKIKNDVRNANIKRKYINGNKNRFLYSCKGKTIEQNNKENK